MMFDRDLDCLAEGVSDIAPLPIRSVRPDGLDAALAALAPDLAAFARASGFTAAPGQLTLLPGGGGLAGALLGLGDDHTPFAHSGLPAALPEGTLAQLEPGDFSLESAVLGFCLGAYQYSTFAAPHRAMAKLLLSEPMPGFMTAPRSAARATWMVRDLINTPANHLGPAELAEATRALGERFGAVSTIVSGERLAAEYPAIAAVGAGSVREPHVASFTWSGSTAGADAPLVSLCGKGVCFDSGGYDLKPSAGMLRMKKDMGGAALMLGLARMVMDADLPVRLAVRIGCVENMVSGAAMRPLDILRTRRGLTVEVGNTDAEGRLILCDLLAEASDERPALLLDAATLTGAARVALGPDLPALFVPHTSAGDQLAEALLAGGLTCGDPLWRLPLWAGYDAWLSSPTADMNNVSSKPMAGAITAALFLQRFIAPGTTWAHLDTYAWNDQNRPGRPEGGEAIGMRALFLVLRTLNHIHKPD